MSDPTGNWPQWIEDAINWVNNNIIKPIKKVVNDIKEDCKNYDKNNQSEEKVLKSNYISSYKGKTVIKTPIKDNAFSFGIIVLGTEVNSVNTVKHEYGHCLQLEKLGIFKYTEHVAIPSLNGYWSGVSYEDYYSQPWEYGADIYGEVVREGYVYDEDAEEKYTIFWDEITN